MKCQECCQAATNHVTEMVAGRAVEYHVCDAHLQALDTLKPATGGGGQGTGFVTLATDPEIQKVLVDREAREKMAAHLLPGLCLALLDPSVEVRIMAAWRLLLLGQDGRSAAGALRDALQDPDERLRCVAKMALQYVEADEEPPHFARATLLRAAL